ncbi:MAG: response regulator transcription factor [Eubacterium sp.]|nr:response regulator transcription factor [Eubacterium sp.]
MKNILVIEDDKEIAELLQVFLEGAGYQVIEAADGVKGIELFQKEYVNLVLLDVLLPKMNGFDVCAEIRKTSDIPIIMITALADEKDQIKGYNLKIDDYVTKPFSVQILLKKIEAVLRRRYDSELIVLKYRNIVLNQEEHTVTVNEDPVFLTNKEFELLNLFMLHPHRTMSKEFLIDRLWQYEDVYDDLIYTHIKNIRKKLGIDVIKTIRGVGYKLD